MNATTPGPDPVDDQITYLVGRARTLAENLVDPGTVDTLDQLAGRRHTPAVRVVVVGEVSRGKSTLINALIKRRLLPDAADALTATWTLLRHGSGLIAKAYVLSDAGLETVLLDTGPDIDAYMTVVGERLVRRRHGAHARVGSIEVEIDAEVLAGGLEIIDTPGVGGLSAPHRYATLAALNQADAVVFVIKPGEPISATERTFLAEAVDRLDACVVVQTQRDATSDADTFLAEDMKTLRSEIEWEKLVTDPAQAQRLADFFTGTKSASVSALNALRAASAADPNDRVNTKLHDNSGIPELVEILKDVVTRGGTLHRRNLLRLVESVVRECANRLRERVEILTQSDAGQRLIDERRRRVAKWTANDGAHWRTVIDEAHRTLVADVNRQARQRAEKINDDYRRRLPDLKTAEIVEATKGMLTLPDSVTAELGQVAFKAVTDAVERVRGLLVEDELDGPLSHLGATQAVFSRLPDGFEAMAGASDPNDARAVLAGGILAVSGAGVGVAALVSALAISTMAPIIVPFLIGAGLFNRLNKKSREQKRTLRGALDTLTIVCDEIRKTAAPAVVENAGKTKEKLVELIEAGLTGLAAQIEQDQNVLQEAEGLTPEERTARTAQAEQELRDAEDVVQAAVNLRNQIS